MPSERSITTRLLEICSHQPWRTLNRKSSTTSTPRRATGAFNEYVVWAPIQASSARTLSYLVGALAVTLAARARTRAVETGGCAYIRRILSGTAVASAARSVSAVASGTLLTTR